MTRPNSIVDKFEQSERGLYYLDTTKQQEKSKPTQHIMFNTIAKNKEMYVNNDYLWVQVGRELQSKIKGFRICKFLWIFDEKILPNSLIMRADTMTAEEILDWT